MTSNIRTVEKKVLFMLTCMFRSRTNFGDVFVHFSSYLDTMKLEHKLKIEGNVLSLKANLHNATCVIRFFCAIMLKPKG